MTNTSSQTPYGAVPGGDDAAAHLALHTGETLDIRTLQPPVPDLDAESIAAFLEAAFGKGDFSVRTTLSGAFEDSSVNTFLVAEIAGELVGTSWFMQARADRSVGVFGEVFTAPEQRGKGIALALTQAAVAGFRAAGGSALYLATGNPVAARVYARAGFATYTGNVMRHLSAPDPGFDDALFAFSEGASVRRAVWGDLPRVVALSVFPHRWLVCHYGLQRISSRYRQQDRCVSIYYPLWRPMEDGSGVLTVLETPDRRLVGVASLAATDTPGQEGTGLLDFLVHENYRSEAGQLVEFTLRNAPAGMRQVTACFAGVDQEKAAIAAQAGFRQEAVRAAALQVGDHAHDVAVYSRSL
jgi:GNAT superfamily N-acetyltransferase